ncbi:MAG: TetR/AcrR family transcriptional regulator [Bacteroidota bacterium]
MSDKNNTTKTIILDAAQSLLADVGETFTMEQLEAKSGISRATIYRRVGSKQTLLQRLAEERGQTIDLPNTKQHILKSAQTVVRRQGLVGATMEAIANEAGVGVATVYRHFGDKDRLLQAFIEEMTPRNTVRSIMMEPTGEVAADLEKIIYAMLIFFYENRDLVRLMLTEGEAERRYLDKLRTRSSSTLNSLTDYFQHQLDAGRIQSVGPASDIALALMGMMMAFAVVNPVYNYKELENPEQCSKLIVRLFLNDLRRGNSS